MKFKFAGLRSENKDLNSVLAGGKERDGWETRMRSHAEDVLPAAGGGIAEEERFELVRTFEAW